MLKLEVLRKHAFSTEIQIYKNWIPVVLLISSPQIFTWKTRKSLLDFQINFQTNFRHIYKYLMISSGVRTVLVIHEIFLKLTLHSIWRQFCWKLSTGKYPAISRASCRPVSQIFSVCVCKTFPGQIIGKFF